MNFCSSSIRHPAPDQTLPSSFDASFLGLSRSAGSVATAWIKALWSSHICDTNGLSEDARGFFSCFATKWTKDTVECFRTCGKRTERIFSVSWWVLSRLFMILAIPLNETSYMMAAERRANALCWAFSLLEIYKASTSMSWHRAFRPPAEHWTAPSIQRSESSQHSDRRNGETLLGRLDSVPAARWKVCPGSRTAYKRQRKLLEVQ